MEKEATNSRQESCEPRGREVVFPDAGDMPALGAEAAGNEAVAGAVALEFFAPEGAVGSGECAVEGAGVPEAAVDEEGEFARGEGEIGVAEEGVAAPPTVDVVAAEEGDEAEFGGLVLGGADGGHDAGTPARGSSQGASMSGTSFM